MGLVVLIDQPGYRLAADRKVMKNAEAAVVIDVAQAFSRAQEQIGMALRQVERFTEQTKEQGYRDGLARATQESAQRLMIAEVDRHRLLRSMQTALADVVFDAIALLAKDVDRKALTARAIEVLQGALREASWARIRVHPQAVEAARGALDDFQQQTGLGQLARVIADESLAEDACVIESEFGRIDASLGTQLEAIRGAIAHAVRQSLEQ
jgi:type III secretion protein L